MNSKYLALSTMVAMGAAFVASDASAATTERDYFSHGTASCQSALPVFDGNIRKRPMALGNEGAATAFVTCDTDSIDNFGGGHSGIAVYVRNRAGAAGVQVNCTLVDGVFTASTFHPKTSPAMEAGEVSLIEWTAADDNGGINFVAPAISCGLPAGVDIPAVEFIYPEEIGS